MPTIKKENLSHTEAQKSYLQIPHEFDLIIYNDKIQATMSDSQQKFKKILLDSQRHLIKELL